MFRRHTLVLVLLLLPIAVAGCGKGGAKTTTTPAGASPGTTAAGTGTEAKEVLLEPFDPPSFEELNAQATWVDQPVLDATELLRETQREEQPLVSVPEALRLRNNTAEDNEKILSALGRLPEQESDVDINATIVRHIGGDVKSTNPLMISSVSEFDVLGLTGVGLFGFDWRMEPFADIDVVKSWQTSEDGMYNKVVLRDDLKWSDGEPITAHDVVFSFQTIMNPNVPVPAVRSGTDQLRWVHAYDDYTIVYFHKESRPTNIWDINFPLIPKHIYEGSVDADPTLVTSPHHIKYENNPVSGGPYKLVRRVRGQELVLQRRDDYFTHNGQSVRPMRYFKEVRFRVIEDPNTSLLALRSGHIEETALTAEQWMTEQTNNDEFYSRNTRATGTEWVEFHLLWNCKTPFFEDVRVRRAMSYAFDHDEMLNKLFYGLYEPATGPFHHTSWMAPKPPLPRFQQDLDKAEQLLDEAGWDDSDGDGIRDKEVNGRLTRFEFSIVCTQTPNSIKVCTLLKENLDRIGIICHVRPMEFTVLQQTLLERKFHAAMGGWGTGTDPDTSVNIFGTGENRNYGQYSNPKVDELFEQGKREFDREKRAAIYSKIHEILYEEQPYTWLFYRNSFYGFNKNLRGYKFSPRGPYNYSPGFASIWKAVP